MFLGQGLHRGALRDVLTNEPVGVLVRAALPGSVWVREVDLDASRRLDLLVAVELRSIVDGDGDEQRGVRLDQLDDPPIYVDDLAAAQTADHRCAGDAFDECNDAVIAAGADNDVHLPVPNLGARLSYCRALRNVRFAGKPTAPLNARIALPISHWLPKVLPELSTALSVALHVGVNRLVTDLENLEQSEPAADLLRTELLAQQRLDQLPFNRAELAVAPRPHAPAVCPLLRDARPVGPVIS